MSSLRDELEKLRELVGELRSDVAERAALDAAADVDWREFLDEHPELGDLDRLEDDDAC